MLLINSKCLILEQNHPMPVKRKHIKFQITLLLIKNLLGLSQKHLYVFYEILLWYGKYLRSCNSDLYL